MAIIPGTVLVSPADSMSVFKFWAQGHFEMPEMLLTDGMVLYFLQYLCVLSRGLNAEQDRYILSLMELIF